MALTEKQQKARLLRDMAASMLSGSQSFSEGEIDFEALLDWYEIDAQHILKRVERFREAEYDAKE